MGILISSRKVFTSPPKKKRRGNLEDVQVEPQLTHSSPPNQLALALKLYYYCITWLRCCVALSFDLDFGTLFSGTFVFGDSDVRSLVRGGGKQASAHLSTFLPRTKQDKLPFLGIKMKSTNAEQTLFYSSFGSRECFTQGLGEAGVLKNRACLCLLNSSKTCWL